MIVESANFYESVRKDYPFTDQFQATIASLGTFDGLRVPDLLLTVDFTLDPKTGYLLKGDRYTKFTFQTDGPSKADLNFPHSSLKPDFKNWFCGFKVRMDIVFGAGVIEKTSGTFGGNLGFEKGAKGGVEASVEKSTEEPGTRTTFHALIQGGLDAKRRKLDVWGEMTGFPNRQRS